MRNIRPIIAAREKSPSIPCPSPSDCTPSTAHASSAPLTSVVPIASTNSKVAQSAKPRARE
jgi:hypothetical protein